MTFAAPLWLYAALALLPLSFALFAWAERRAARRLARLAAPALRAGLLASAETPVRRRVRFGLWTLALAALAVALARPQRGFEEQAVKRRGLDLLVAVDVSKSMLATDLAPSRLGRARLAILDLLALLPGDRVGLVAFAGTAFLQAPLTIDYGAIRESVNELDPDLIPRGGTEIGAAVDVALDAFGKAEGSNRAILLLTDGEDLGADTLLAAERAKKAGVKVFTVGLGTAAGANVPLPRTPFENAAGGAVARERDGRPHVSRLDEDRLRAIADATGGQYVHLTGAAGRDSELRGLVTGGLGAMQTADIDARSRRRPIERYQWPLGLALALLAASAGLGERRRKNRPHTTHQSHGSHQRPPPVPAVLAVAAVLLAAVPAPLRAVNDPRTLYDQGRYQEAGEAYEQLLKKNPGSGKLQFGLGASRFSAGDFDGAFGNFTGALAAPDADAALQARTFYNLGNTLFKRGEAQKEGSPARLNDWKNAIQYYNSVLQAAAPPAPKVDPKAHEELRRDAEHNRDYVQRRLDEELNRRPPPPQKQPPKKKPDDQKKDKDKGKDKDKDKDKDKGKDQDKDKSDKGDQPDDQGGQGENGQPGQGPPKPDANQGQGQGESDQPPTNDPNGSKGQNPRPQRDPQKAGDQSDEPQPDENADQPPPSGAGEGQPQDRQANGANSGQQPQPEPEHPGPRPQGELSAREPAPGQSPGEPEGPAEGEAAAEGPATGGGTARMSAAQARALLRSLRNEDDRVQLLQPNARKRSREAAFNDW